VIQLEIATNVKNLEYPIPIESPIGSDRDLPGCADRRKSVGANITATKRRGIVNPTRQ
jgi:hypothetical protein